MLINLSKNKKYLLACSYGPDSMALFHLLLTQNFKFAVAHVNYNMRGEHSERAALNLKEYSKKHNIEYFELSLKGQELTGNFQAKAREIRYSYFQRLMKKYSFAALLTAHHEDDHIETYLMQKASKKTLFYYGIQKEITYEDIKVIRPLLSLTKEELLLYNKKHDIPYEIDSSNLETHYMRNKFRINVLNKLTKEEKDALLNEIVDKNAESKQLKLKVSSLVTETKVNISKYLKLTNKEKEFLIYLLFSRLSIEERFSKGKFKNIDDAINKNQTSAMFKIYKDFYFVKAYEYFTVIDLKEYQSYSINLKSPKNVIAAHFTAKLADLRGLEQFPVAMYPLEITTAKAEDFYIINTYKKKITRMYVDMKLPRHLRRIWPVVKDSSGNVVFVPRYRVDYKISEKDVFIIKT